MVSLAQSMAKAADHGGFRFRVDVATPCTSQPDLFFSDHAAHARVAAASCEHCPFLLECRLEGLERGEFGTWGGLSHNQRARMGVDGRAREGRRVRRLLEQRQEGTDG